MADREYSVVEAIGRINRFADSHLTAFPTDSQAAKDFARLGVIDSTLKPTDSKPGLPPSPGTLARQKLIDDLWVDLLAIAETARTIARKEPGFAADFRVCDDSQRQIIATATAFHEKLQDADIAAKFFAYLMPADLVTELHNTLKKIDGKKDQQIDDQLEDITETAETRPSSKRLAS